MRRPLRVSTIQSAIIRDECCTKRTSDNTNLLEIADSANVIGAFVLNNKQVFTNRIGYIACSKVIGCVTGSTRTSTRNVIVILLDSEGITQDKLNNLLWFWWLRWSRCRTRSWIFNFNSSCVDFNVAANRHCDITGK